MKSKMIALTILFSIIVGIYAVSNANCQTVTPTPTPTPDTVSVSRDFIADANKAFDLVVQQREAIAKLLEERKMSETERASALALIASFDKLIAVKDQISAEKDKIIALYERVIQMYQNIVANLEKQLNKPRSALQRFLKGLKEALLVIAGIAIGRGVGI